MMRFGALKYFGSVITKLKKIIVLYQPRDLHLWHMRIKQLHVISIHKNQIKSLIEQRY